MHAQLNVTKCPAKSERKPPPCNVKVNFCVRVIILVRIKVTVYVSLRRRVRKTLYSLYCPYFLPEVMVKYTRKARRHFVTLIEVCMHLITCISVHNCQ